MPNHTIDKNIPLPPKAYDKFTSYPFKEMLIGDSIYIEGKLRKNFAARFAWLKKNKGFIFTTRCEKDGIRVWRIE